MNGDELQLGLEHASSSVRLYIRVRAYRVCVPLIIEDLSHVYTYNIYLLCRQDNLKAAVRSLSVVEAV